MTNNTNIPNNYQPFEKLVICGNTLINGSIPIAVDGNPVFLIGKGEPPRLWLNVPNKNKEWTYVVADGVSKNTNIRVLHSGRVVAIYLNEQIIFQATKEDETYMIITHIDLTSFGLAIKGDISSLKIGGQQMIGNTFENVGTMVSVK